MVLIAVKLYANDKKQLKDFLAYILMKNMSPIKHKQSKDFLLPFFIEFISNPAF